MRVFQKMLCCTRAVGCRKFVQYMRMLYPGRFILVESVYAEISSNKGIYRLLLKGVKTNKFNDFFIIHDIWAKTK